MSEVSIPTGEIPGIQHIEIPESIRLELVSPDFFAGINSIILTTRQTGNEHGFIKGVELADDRVEGVVTSTTIVGTSRNIPLYQAQLELANRLNTVSLVRIHTHPGGHTGLSNGDKQVWRELEKQEIVEPSQGCLKKIVGNRPVNIIVTAMSEKPEENDVTVLVQTADQVNLDMLFGNTWSRTVSIITHQVSIEEFDEDLSPDRLASLNSFIANAGFQIGRFSLDEQAQIQDFILRYLPREIVLEDIQGSTDIPRPNLPFLTPQE